MFLFSNSVNTVERNAINHKNVIYSQEIFKKQVSNFAFKAILMLLIIAICFTPDLAHATAGLSKATGAMQKFETAIKPLIRILAVIGVIFVGLAYAFEWLSNQTLVKIIIGLIIIASANEMVGLILD